MESPVEIFCCYADRDQDLLAELETHLSPLRRQGVIVTWHSLNIIPGTNAEEERSKHLNNAQVILLLISPDFLASDHCYDQEMMRAIRRHQQGEAVVIPIILRPTYWEEAPFAHLQALPTDKKPVVTWYYPDEAWVDITRGIKKAVKELVRKLALPSQSKKSGVSWQDSSREGDSGKLAVEETSSFDVIVRCPCCLDQFYVGDCDIVSRTDGRLLRKGPAPNEWRTPRRENVESLTSPKYLRQLAGRQCPHCGYGLPFNIERAKNISLAIVGDTYSGKSHYIASVIHTLRERWLPEHRKSVSLTCLTPEVEHKYYHDVIRPVFVDKISVPATQPTSYDVSEPLIYELKFKSSSGEAPKRVNLLFYDGSGEDYAWQERMVRHARHVMYASAFIFLIDPPALTEVAKHIEEANQLPPFYLAAYRSGRSPVHAIKTTLELFERYHGSQAENLLRSLPVAITLSKADLFRHVASVAPAYRFLSHSRYGKSLHLQEMNAIDEEVRTLVKKYKGYSLLRLSQRFSTVSFFATSATGCAPDEMGRFRFIEPYRCLDPVLWALYRLGVLHADTR
jgi:hypothetical protein